MISPTELASLRQEALSAKYGNNVILLLPLRGNKLAIFNSARELCGIISYNAPLLNFSTILELWHLPTTSPEPYKHIIDEAGLSLDDLGI